MGRPDELERVEARAPGALSVARDLGGEPSEDSERRRLSLDGLLEGLPHSEPDAAASGDRNRLAGLRISTGARLACLHLEGAEAAEGDAPVALEADPDAVQHGVNQPCSLEPGRTQFLSNVGDEVALVHGKS